MRLGKIFLAVLASLMLAAPSFAGMGIHLTYGLNPLEAEDYPITFANDVANYPGQNVTSTFQRAESGNPIGGGFDLSFGMIPKIDLILSLDASLASYEVMFIPADVLKTANPALTDVGYDNVPYINAGLDLTALYSPFGFPPVAKVFHVEVGGGLTARALFPVPDETLITDNITTATDSPDMEEIAKDYAQDIGIGIGVHAMAGVKIKPPATPIGLRAYVKYYVMLSGAEDPAPSSWMNAGVGIFFGF